MQTAIRLILMLLILGPGPAVQAAERFIDNGDGTITDTQQNLMWAATDNHGDIDWHQAEKWIRFTFPLTLPVTYENWRLPALAELRSLAEGFAGEGYEAECGQRLKLTPLIRLTCGWVWSSNSDAVAPTAYVFNFDNVYHYSVRKAHRRGYRALAVRNLENQ
jgi:hypothetical protein